ncbi:MAG: hypothetical protein ICV79_09320 [Flavisolibacter sp.]|nr:hypothetical protein [Flavisolibacter sp.]
MLLPNDCRLLIIVVAVFIEKDRLLSPPMATPVERSLRRSVQQQECYVTTEKVV